MSLPPKPLGVCLALLLCVPAFAVEQPAGNGGFLAACEISINKTLLAPSTFRRIGLSETREALTFDHYFSANPEPSANVQKLLRSMATQPPVRLVALIEYDATNAYGTPIRSVSRCTYDALDGDGSKATEYSVRIDGRTTTERLVDQVKSLTSRTR